MSSLTSLDKSINYDELFKEEWVNQVIHQLDLKEDSRKTVEDLFSLSYVSTEINIYNTFAHTSKKIKSTEFYYLMKKIGILNENGVITVKHGIKESPFKIAMSLGVELRQSLKKLKQLSRKENNHVEAVVYEALELVFKTVINAAYGLGGYPGSNFCNIDVASTTTTAGRNIVSVSAVQAELLGGGYRNYLIDGHIALIKYVMDTYTDISYTLPETNVEEVLHHMLGHYYENYYMLSYLRQKLTNLPYKALQVLYIKNNYKVFMKIPEVEALYRKMISNATEEDYIVNHKSGTFSDDIRTVYKMSKELLYGFVYFNGDYIDGVYCPTLVDVIANLRRESIVGIDTDSNILTVYKERSRFLEYYNDVLPDNEGYKKRRDIFASMLIGHSYLSCIEESLLKYTEAIGIEDEELRKKIEFELETVSEQWHATVSKKQYLTVPVVQDMSAVKGHKVKQTGVLWIKSNFNADISSTVDDIVKNHVVNPMSKLDHTELVDIIHDGTLQIMKELRDPNYVRNKRSVLKIASSGIALRDFRKKAVELWNDVYGALSGVDIELPGSFGIIPIKFNEDVLEWLKQTNPKEYELLNNHANKLYIYKLCSRAYKISEVFISELEGELAEEGKPLAKKLSLIFDNSNLDYRDSLEAVSRGILTRDINDYDKILHETLEIELERATPKYKELLISLWGVPKKKTNNEIIITECKRLAVPVDLVDIPETISYNDYSIIDYKSAGELGHLISSVANTLGLSTLRNSEGRIVVSSILQTF